MANKIYEFTIINRFGRRRIFKKRFTTKNNLEAYTLKLESNNNRVVYRELYT